MSSENFNITIVGNNNNSNFLFNSNNSKMIEASITEIENNIIKKKCTCDQDVSPEKCKIIEELYNNDVLGKSCCTDPSQPWCDPLKTLDAVAMRRYVMDALDFDSAMDRITKAWTVWWGLDAPLYIDTYGTPIWQLTNESDPIKDLEDNLQTVMNISKLEYRYGILEGAPFEAFFWGAREGYTKMTILMRQKGKAVDNRIFLVIVHLDNRGRIIGFNEADPNSVYETYPGTYIEDTGKIDTSDPLVYGSWSSYTEPVQFINSSLPMSELPNKLRDLIMNQSLAGPGSLPDPMNLENSIVFEWDGLVKERGDLRALWYFSPTTWSPVLGLIVNDGERLGHSRDVDINNTFSTYINTDSEFPMILTLRAYTSKVDLVKNINLFRTWIGYSPVTW